MPPEAKRRLLEPAHPRLSLARQCALLGVSRSSFYYRPRGEGAENLHFMRLLDEQYTQTPFYGVRRMTAWRRQQGYAVNPKRVAWLIVELKNDSVAKTDLSTRRGWACAAYTASPNIWLIT